MIFFCLLTFSFISACSTGHCRRDGSKVSIKEDVKPPSGYKQEQLGTVFVAKSDGSLQCGVKAGIKIQDMASELKNIEIISAKKEHDGLMRIQACGTGTGLMNVYEIRSQDLSKAQKLGFSLFQSDK